MSDCDKILKICEEHGINFISLQFTDANGVWHHVAQHISTINDDVFEDGLMFDGSSIEGWKAINESDMILKPDASRPIINPFTAEPELILFCDILDPSTGLSYNRDPRSIAKAAVTYMSSQDIGDTAYFGPEAEFFMFDNVRWSTKSEKMSYQVDSEESPHNNDSEYEEGNMGHRPRVKGGYFPASPVDSGTDIRAEMVQTMVDMGLNVEKHHHEVAPAQHELGLKFGELIEMADNMQIYKWTVRNVAHSFGKTATFMPKPVYGDNGSGMHVHISIWKDGKNSFAGSQYADLSENCLYFIGGVIKHAKAINAFTNPTTNSYKRLIPGFEAPVLLAYSARNRSASCRIPYVSSASGKRAEFRFPDPMANPYLAYTALLMAGIDGIKNKMHPGEAMDKNLYDLAPEELSDVPTVCHSLQEALESLDKDREFLKAGDVMDDDFINSYLNLKWEEVYYVEHAPTPMEFDLYYSR